MKVGDVVVQYGQFGIVFYVYPDGRFNTKYATYTCVKENPYSVIVPRGVKLNADQRAFVDATIAAEALRRMGGGGA